MLDEIIKTKKPGDVLSDDEFSFMMDFLKYHPKYLYIKRRNPVRMIVQPSTHIKKRENVLVIQYADGKSEVIGKNPIIQECSARYNKIIKEWVKQIKKSQHFSLVSNVSKDELKAGFLNYLGMDYVYQFVTHPHASKEIGRCNTLFTAFCNYLKRIVKNHEKKNKRNKRKRKRKKEMNKKRIKKANKK